MKKIWVKKFTSFNAANAADELYYLKMTPAERLDTMFFLSKVNFKLKGVKQHESGQRLRRVVKIFQQA